MFLAGRVAVETDGVVIDEARFPGRQGRLLFAYLVAEQGRPVPRDELAEALWGDEPPATWDKALTRDREQAARPARGAGVDGANALTAPSAATGSSCPREAGSTSSWRRTRRRRRRRRSRPANWIRRRPRPRWPRRSLRQPFLPGEDGAWVEEKRREFADVRGRALSALADACLRSGDAAEAAKWAEQAIALAPFRETGYRRLMEAHAAAGNRAEALRVYERCRRLLAEELGAYPSPETESIYPRPP